jgi:hypothetical protein
VCKFITNDHPKIEVFLDEDSLDFKDLMAIFSQISDINFARVAIIINSLKDHTARKLIEILRTTKIKNPYILYHSNELTDSFATEICQKTCFMYRIVDPTLSTVSMAPTSSIQFREHLLLRPSQPYNNDRYMGDTLLREHSIWDLSELPPNAIITLSKQYDGKIKVWDEIISESLITKHPCLSYLADKVECHAKRICPARRITILNNGLLVPYSLPDYYALGNVDLKPLSELITNCWNTEGGDRFLRLVRLALSSFVTTGAVNIFSMDSLLRYTDRRLRCN